MGERVEEALLGRVEKRRLGTTLIGHNLNHSPTHPAPALLPPQGGKGNAGNVGALELVAMDMKAQGMFVCRTLSFAGVLCFRVWLETARAQVGPGRVAWSASCRHSITVHPNLPNLPFCTLQ